MDAITKETRNEGYQESLVFRQDRAKVILEVLGVRELTVDEIVDELIERGVIPHYNRNYVAPRLTELEEMGIVETVGKRQARYSNKQIAIYRRVELPNLFGGPMPSPTY